MATSTTRRRRLDTSAEVKPPVIAPELISLASESYRQNKAMNDAKSKYEKARKNLYQKMTEAGVKSFDAIVAPLEEGGSPVTIDAVISTPSGNAVSVEKLQKLVTAEQFLKMVTVSQADVEAIVGKSILNQVLVSTTGTENVSVKARK